LRTYDCAVKVLIECDLGGADAETEFASEVAHFLKESLEIMEAHIRHDRDILERQRPSRISI
jgi:hypothetical protein